MFVTRDVLKLSGWLNAVADCRVERRAYDTGRVRFGPAGVRAWGGDGASGMHGEGPTQGCGAQGTRGAHPEHRVHVRDAGRVEVERLVELRRLLPSRKAGMRCGKRYGPGGVRALGAAAMQAACMGRARLKDGGLGTCGAHVEHLIHVRDAGRVETEWLVER